MQKHIYACLWSDGQAKEMATYYCSIFKDSEMITQNKLVSKFRINGTEFMALNGGPQYKFTPATSFVIECDTQEEIDHYWDALGKEGLYRECGWLDDRFGVSWQVVPKVLGQLMSDPERAPRVAQAFMKMKKFDIETLMNA